MKIEGRRRSGVKEGKKFYSPVRPAVNLMMKAPVMAKPTRKGQFRLNSLLKNTGHGSNFLISPSFSPCPLRGDEGRHQAFGDLAFVAVNRKTCNRDRLSEVNGRP